MSTPKAIEEESWTDFETTKPVEFYEDAAAKRNGSAPETGLTPDDVFAIYYTINYWKPSQNGTRQPNGDLYFTRKCISDLISLRKTADFQTASEIFVRRVQKLLPELRAETDIEMQTRYRLSCSNVLGDYRYTDLDEDNWLAVMKLRQQSSIRIYLSITTTSKDYSGSIVKEPAEGCVVQ